MLRSSQCFVLRSATKKSYEEELWSSVNSQIKPACIAFA